MKTFLTQTFYTRTFLNMKIFLITVLVYTRKEIKAWSIHVLSGDSRANIIVAIDKSNSTCTPTTMLQLLLTCRYELKASRRIIDDEGAV